MHSSPVFKSFVIALLPTAVFADWAKLEDAVKTQLCSTACNGVGPGVENTSFDDVCARLVEDGCTNGAVALNPGAASFAKSDDVSCDDARPAGHLTCTNAFRSAYAQIGGWGGIGATRAGTVWVVNADGVQLGAIGFSAGCLPVNPTEPGGC